MFQNANRIQHHDEILDHHEALEQRQAQIEVRELARELCKFCGDQEFKQKHCQKCYQEHRSDFLGHIGFISGWMIGSGVGALAVNPVTGAFVFSLGLSVAVITSLSFKSFSNH